MSGWPACTRPPLMSRRTCKGSVVWPLGPPLQQEHQFDQTGTFTDSLQATRVRPGIRQTKRTPPTTIMESLAWTPCIALTTPPCEDADDSPWFDSIPFQVRWTSRFPLSPLRRRTTQVRCWESDTKVSYGRHESGRLT